MTVTEYVILFALVAIMGAGLPGPGDASLIAAGTLAGEGRVHLGTVLAVSAVAWLLGSLAGYTIGVRKGRGLLDHAGRWEKSRRRLLGKGDRAFAGHTLSASVTMPAFVSGIFRVPLKVFVLGAAIAGIGWIGMYVGLSYFFGAEIAARIGQAGSRLLLGVIVIVGVGLGLRVAYSHWRAAHDHRPA
jgi:membrane protein DedA with SNARE-associated domain